MPGLPKYVGTDTRRNNFMSQATRDHRRKLCRKRHALASTSAVVVHKLLTAFGLLPDALDECYREPKHDKLSHSFRIGDDRAHGQDCKEDYLS